MNKCVMDVKFGALGTTARFGALLMFQQFFLGMLHIQENSMVGLNAKRHNLLPRHYVSDSVHLGRPPFQKGWRNSRVPYFMTEVPSRSFRRLNNKWH
jgi:hypothetical protein